MTTVQLAQRLASRFLQPGELNLLPGDAHLALCDAINTAATDFYADAPASYRRGTVSFVLPAPATIQGVGVTNNSAALAGSAFTPDQTGCSVQLSGGDSHWNQVAGADALVDAYLGASGTVAATVYGDTALFGAGVFASLVGEPRLFSLVAPRGHVLIRDEGLRERRWYRGPLEIGRPRVYSIGPTALPGGSANLFALRIHPVPDIACDLRVDADLQPLQFAPDDLFRSLDLPVPEHLCLTILLPLAAIALADTAGSHWRAGVKPPDRAAVDKRFAALPHNFGTPNNVVGTPLGY